MQATPICHKHVLKKWLKSGFVFEGKYSYIDEETPQEGIISSTLCNIAINGIEHTVNQHYPLTNWWQVKDPKYQFSDMPST